MSHEDRPVEFHVPDALRVGVYANTGRFWYSESEFTLDWAVMEPAEVGEAETAIVCSRVRIPVGLVFDVLQGLNRVMTSYEQEFGEIRRFGA